MLEWLISFFLIGTGLWNSSLGLLALGSGLFLFLVIAQFIGSSTQEETVSKKETTKKKKKYKLIQAPSGAWESDEIYPHMMSPPWSAATGGKGIPNIDPLEKSVKEFDDETVSGTIRQFLPFPEYGGPPAGKKVVPGFPRPVNRVLAGLPISLSKFLGYKKKGD